MAKIMITDDDAGVLDLLTYFFGRTDHQVVATATSGAESIGLAEIHMPDLALMDVQMPGEMDGIGAAAVLKDKFATPVIFMTGYVTQDIKDRTESLGRYKILTKPFDIVKLQTTIEGALSVSRQQAIDSTPLH